MAKFEGIKWGPKQLRYLLPEKKADLLPAAAQVYAVSRSVHYGLFLAFEGIRFFCRSAHRGKLEIVFANWDKNLERFRRGIAFNLGSEQQYMVPSIAELEDIFIRRYFQDPTMRPFLTEMAELGAQGYLRPFTVDEEQSIGVTFPGRPAIHAVACRYDQYLGEPFSGVVVPNLVRAVGSNQTGCLKLGVNYLMSVKAVDAAKTISPGAAAALFLDDRTHLPLAERQVTEWDSSCCLFALSDGSVVKIPEGPLILPSVTIIGLMAILKKMGITTSERHVPYGELLEKTKKKKLVAICSVGTAGILNRCQKLVLVDEKNRLIDCQQPDEKHPLYAKMAEVRSYFWDIYRGRVEAPETMKISVYQL